MSILRAAPATAVLVAILLGNSPVAVHGAAAERETHSELITAKAWGPVLHLGSGRDASGPGPVEHDRDLHDKLGEPEEDSEDGLRVETVTTDHRGHMRTALDTTGDTPGGVRDDVYRPPRL